MSKDWVSLYQLNPDKFIEDYFDIKLTWYQRAMMKTMDNKPVIYPRYQGRHNVYEVMQEVYKVLYGNK